MTAARSEDRSRDVTELGALVVAYATAADLRDGPAFADVFTEDGCLVVPRLLDGPDPVVERRGRAVLQKAAPALDRYRTTFHQVTNHVVDVDGDQATGDVQCVAHHVTEEPPDPPVDDGRVATDVVWYIRYRDRYRRTPEGWRIARRELHLQWIEERPVARLGVAGHPGGTGRSPEPVEGGRGSAGEER